MFRYSCVANIYVTEDRKSLGSVSSREANERERAADERARSWEGRAELGTTLLRAAEDRTDRAQAERQAAERLADTERVARLAGLPE